MSSSNSSAATKRPLGLSSHLRDTGEGAAYASSPAAHVHRCPGATRSCPARSAVSR